MRNPPRSLLVVRVIAAMLLAAVLLARLPSTPGHATPVRTAIVPAVDVIVVADTTPMAAAIRLDPPPPRPVGQRSVFFVGDSLTFGADYFGHLSAKLVAAGYQARIDAKVARFMPAGATLLLTEAAAGRLEPLVVVGLGTNEVYAGRSNAEISAGIDQVMAAVDDRWVIWINVKMADTVAADRFNRILAAKAKLYPRLLVADWKSTNTAQYLQYDGVHLSPAGYVVRADFYINTLNFQTR